MLRAFLFILSMSYASLSFSGTPEHYVINADRTTITLSWVMLSTHPSQANLSQVSGDAFLDHQQNMQNHIDVRIPVSSLEASNLLPFLIEKVFGHNTDRFRTEATQLLTIIDDIYQPKAVMAALVVGFDSKNKRVFSECLKEAGNMIVKYGVSVCDKSDKKILLSMAAAGLVW